MRPLIALLILILPLIQCCKKPLMCCEPEPGYQAPDGTWRLVESDGGISGGKFPVPADSVFLLRLHYNWTYARQNNGRVVDTGRYDLTDTAIAPNKDTLAFIFNAGTPEIFRFAAGLTSPLDSLFLADGFADGFLRTYVRVN